MKINYEDLRERQLSKICNVFYNILSIDKQEGYTEIEIKTSWTLKQLRSILNDNYINYECIIYNKEVTTIEL